MSFAYLVYDFLVVANAVLTCSQQVQFMQSSMYTMMKIISGRNPTLSFCSVVVILTVYLDVGIVEDCLTLCDYLNDTTDVDMCIKLCSIGGIDNFWKTFERYAKAN